MRFVWSIVLAALTVPAAWYCYGYGRLLAGSWGAWGELSTAFFLHPRLTISSQADGLVPQPDGPPRIHYTGLCGVDWFRTADPPTGVDPQRWSISSLAVAAPSLLFVLSTVGYAAMSLRDRELDRC